jgi:hypothetical protein
MRRHTEIWRGNFLRKAHFQNQERDGKTILMWILIVVYQARRSAKFEVLTVVLVHIPVVWYVTLSLG